VAGGLDPLFITSFDCFQNLQWNYPTPIIETIEDIAPMTFPSNIDRMRTRQVAERYGIEYNSLHNRMNKLGIKPTKEGRESFLSGDDIALLDRLHNHLSVSGNTFANFIIEEGAVIPLARETSGEKKMELVKSSNVSSGSIVSSDLVEILNVFARQQYDILSPQKKLLEAAYSPVSFDYRTGLTNTWIQQEHYFILG